MTNQESDSVVKHRERVDAAREQERVDAIPEHKLTAAAKRILERDA